MNVCDAIQCLATLTSSHSLTTFKEGDALGKESIKIEDFCAFRIFQDVPSVSKAKTP